MSELFGHAVGVMPQAPGQIGQAPVSKFFICYRRDDSAYAAGILNDALGTRFGSDNVFMDVDTVPPGVDFREYLDEAVSRCDVLLALIGDSWLSAGGEEGRRLDDPADFVRIELEAALARGVHVVPVLVGRASMPTERALPPSLRDFAYRNAVELRPGRDLGSHLSRLVQDLERLPAVSRAEAELREAWIARHRDRVAEAIHEKYRRDMRSKKSATDPTMVPWSELAEEERESKRDEADDIARKLSAIGCRFAPVEDREPELIDFSPEEAELMAELEHERWMAERRQAGWTYGAHPDFDRRVSPYLLPWGRLPEKIQRTVRDYVLGIPGVLADAGFEIRRT